MAGIATYLSSIATSFQNIVAMQGPTGSVGSTGPQGPTGANGSGFNFRGTWASNTAYAALDVVTTGTAPTLQVQICVNPHTSGGAFSAGSNWSIGEVQGPAGMVVMIWTGSAYVQAGTSTQGRPSSGSYPGGTIFYIGPTQPTDALTNDPWFNYSAT